MLNFNKMKTNRYLRPNMLFVVMLNEVCGVNFDDNFIAVRLVSDFHSCSIAKHIVEFIMPFGISLPSIRLSYDKVIYKLT